MTSPVGSSVPGDTPISDEAAGERVEPWQSIFEAISDHCIHTGEPLVSVGCIDCAEQADETFHALVSKGFVTLSSSPLLVSAEAERRGADEVNRLRRLSYNDGYNDGYATVEGLRAELAERDAKIRAIVAAIHAEIRDPYAAAVAPSICAAVDEAIEGLSR